MQEKKLPNLNIVPKEKPIVNGLNPLLPEEEKLEKEKPIEVELPKTVDVPDIEKEKPFEFPKTEYKFSMGDLKNIGKNIEIQDRAQKTFDLKVSGTNKNITESLKELDNLLNPPTEVEEPLQGEDLKDYINRFAGTDLPNVKNPTKKVIKPAPIKPWQMSEQWRQNVLNSISKMENSISLSFGQNALDEFYKKNPDLSVAVKEYKAMLSGDQWKNITTEREYEEFSRTNKGTLLKIPVLSEIFRKFTGFYPREKAELERRKTLSGDMAILSPTLDFGRTVAEKSVSLLEDMATGTATLFTLVSSLNSTNEEFADALNSIFKQSVESKKAIGETFGTQTRDFQKPALDSLGESNYPEAIKTFFGDVSIGTAEQIPNLISLAYPAAIATSVPLRFVGMGTTSLLQHVSEVFGNSLAVWNKDNSVNKDSINMVAGKSLLASAVNAASDIASFEILFGKWFRNFKPELSKMKTTELVKIARSSIGFNIGKQIIQFGATEIPQEIFQEMMKRAAANQPLFDESAIKQYEITAYRVSTSFPLAGVGAAGRQNEKTAARNELIYRNITDTSQFTLDAQQYISNIPQSSFDYTINLAPPTLVEPTTEPSVVPPLSTPPSESPSSISTRLIVDVPSEEWLQGKIDAAKKRGRNRFGVPDFNNHTSYFEGKPLRISLDILSKLRGTEGEQQNVRAESLKYIKDIMKKTGKMPTDEKGIENLPFIGVAYDGVPWIWEGNHRIMAAKDLGFKDLPVKIMYFDGGERIESGPLYPKKILPTEPIAEPEQVSPLPNNEIAISELKNVPKFKLENSTFVGSKLNPKQIEERLKKNDIDLETGNYYKKPSTSKRVFDLVNKFSDDIRTKMIKQMASGKFILVNNADDMPSWFNRDREDKTNLYNSLGFHYRENGENKIVLFTDNLWNYAVRKINEGIPNATTEDYDNLLNTILLETFLHENVHSGLIVYSPKEMDAVLKRVGDKVMSHSSVTEAFDDAAYQSFVSLMNIYLKDNENYELMLAKKNLDKEVNNIKIMLSNSSGATNVYESIKFGRTHMRNYNLIGIRLSKLILETGNLELQQEFDKFILNNQTKTLIQNLVSGQTDSLTSKFLSTAYSIKLTENEFNFAEEILAYSLENTDINELNKSIFDFNDYVSKIKNAVKSKRQFLTKNNVKSIVASSIKYTGRSFRQGLKYGIGSTEHIEMQYPNAYGDLTLNDYIKILALNTINTSIKRGVYESNNNPTRLELGINKEADEIFDMDSNERKILNDSAIRASSIYIKQFDYSNSTTEDERKFLKYYANEQNIYFETLLEQGVEPGRYLVNDNSGEVIRYAGMQINENDEMYFVSMARSKKAEINQDGYYIYDQISIQKAENLENYTVLTTEEVMFLINAKAEKERREMTDGSEGVEVKPGHILVPVNDERVRKLFEVYFSDGKNESQWFKVFLRSVRFTQSTENKSREEGRLTNAAFVRSAMPYATYSYESLVDTAKNEDLFNRRKGYVKEGYFYNYGKYKEILEEPGTPTLNQIAEASYAKYKTNDLKNDILRKYNAENLIDIDTKVLSSYLIELGFGTELVNEYVEKSQKAISEAEESAEKDAIDSGETELEVIAEKREIAKARSFKEIQDIFISIFTPYYAQEASNWSGKAKIELIAERVLAVEKINKKMDSIVSDLKELEKQNMSNSWVISQNIKRDVDYRFNKSLVELKKQLMEENDELLKEQVRLENIENKTVEQLTALRKNKEKGLYNQGRQRELASLYGGQQFGSFDKSPSKGSEIEREYEIKTTWNEQKFGNNTTAEKVSAVGYAFVDILERIEKGNLKNLQIPNMDLIYKDIKLANELVDQRKQDFISGDQNSENELLDAKNKLQILNDLLRRETNRQKEYQEYLIELDKSIIEGRFYDQDVSSLVKEREHIKDYDNWLYDNVLSRYLNRSASLAYLKLQSLGPQDAMSNRQGDGSQDPEEQMQNISGEVENEFDASELELGITKLFNEYSTDEKGKFYNEWQNQIHDLKKKIAAIENELVEKDENTVDRIEEIKILTDSRRKLQKQLRWVIRNTPTERLIVFDAALAPLKERVEKHLEWKEEFPNEIGPVYQYRTFVTKLVDDKIYKSVDETVKVSQEVSMDRYKREAKIVAVYLAIKDFINPSIQKFKEVTTEIRNLDPKTGAIVISKKTQLVPIGQYEWNQLLKNSNKDERGGYSLLFRDTNDNAVRVRAKTLYELSSKVMRLSEFSQEPSKFNKFKIFRGLTSQETKRLNALDSKISKLEDDIKIIQKNGEKIVTGKKTIYDFEASAERIELNKYKFQRNELLTMKLGLAWDVRLNEKEKFALYKLVQDNLIKFGIPFSQNYVANVRRMILEDVFPQMQLIVNRYVNKKSSEIGKTRRSGNIYPLSYTNELMTKSLSQIKDRMPYKLPNPPTENVSPIGVVDVDYSRRKVVQIFTNAIATGITTGIGIYTYSNSDRIQAGLGWGETLLDYSPHIGATLGALYIINNTDLRLKRYLEAVNEHSLRIKDKSERAKFIVRTILDKRFGFSEREKYQLLRFQEKWFTLTTQIAQSANALERSLLPYSYENGNADLGIDYNKSLYWANLVNTYFDPTDAIINSGKNLGPDKEILLLPLSQEIYNHPDFVKGREQLKIFLELQIKTLSETSSDDPSTQNFNQKELERYNITYDIWFGFSEDSKVKALLKWERDLTKMVSNPSYITGFPKENKFKDLPKEARLDGIALAIRKKKIEEIQEVALSALPEESRIFAEDIKSKLEYISKQEIVFIRDSQIKVEPSNKKDDVEKLSKDMEIELKLGEYLPTVYEAFDSHKSWLSQPNFEQKKEAFRLELLKQFKEGTFKNQIKKLDSQEKGRMNHKTGQIVPNWGSRRVNKIIKELNTVENKKKTEEWRESLTQEGKNQLAELLDRINSLPMHETESVNLKGDSASSRFEKRKLALLLDISYKLMKVEDFAYNKFIAITNKIENASYIDFANTNAANQYIPSIINKAIFIDKNMSLLDSYQKYLGRLENPWERAAVGSVKNIMFLSSVAFQKKLSETLIEQGFASEQASDIFSKTFVAEEINASLALSKAAQFGFLNKLNYSPYGKFLALAWIEQSTNNSLYVKSIGVTKVVQVVLNSGTWIRQILSDGVAAFTFGGFDKNPLNAGRLLSATVAMQRAYRFGTPVTKDERFKDNFEQLLTPETIKKFGSVDAVINLIMAAGVFEENIVAKDILNSLGENQTAFSPLSTIGFVKNTKELYKNIIKGEFTKEAFAKVQKQGLKDSRSYVKSTVSNIGYFFGTTNNAGRLAVALKFINSFSASTFTPQEIVGISYQLTHSVVPRFENYPEMIKLATRYGIFNPYIFFEYMGTRGLFNQLKNLSMMQKKVDFEKLVGRPITEEELKVTKELSHTLLLQLVIGLGLNYFLIFGNPFGDDEEEENKLSQANKSNIDKLLSGFLTSKNYKFKYDFKTRELQLISREYASYFAPAIFATKYGVMGLTQLYNEISEPGDWDYDKSSASGGIRTLTDLTRTKLTQNVISPLTQLGTMVLSGRDIRTGQYLGDIREDGRNATIVEKIVPAFKATLEANSPPDIKRINKILEDKMEIKDWVELATLGQSTYRVQLDKFWSGSIYQETQNLRNVISDFGKNVNELEEGENIDFNIKRHSKNYIINRDVIIEKSKYLQGSGLVNQDEFVKYITGNYGSKTPLINDSELQVYSIYGTQFVLDSLNEIEGENSLEIKTWAIKHYLNDLPIDKQVDIITNQTSDRFKTLFESGKMGSSATFNGQPITEYSWESFDLKTKQDIVSHFNKSFAWLYAGMKINEEQDKDEQYKYISDISADGTTEIRETPDSRSLTKLKKDLIEDSSNISPKTDSSYGFLNEEEKLQTIYRIKYGINELVKQGKSIKGSLVVDSKGNFIFSGTDSERRDIERTLQFMLLKTFKSGDSKDITKNRLGFKNVSSADAADFGFFDREKHPKTNKETVFVDKNSDIAKVFTTKELIENIINNIPLVVESKTTITTRGRR